MTLLEWASQIADKEHWEDNTYLQNVCPANGYFLSEIRRTFFACFDNKNAKALINEEEEPIHGLAVVPFY